MERSEIDRAREEHRDRRPQTRQLCPAGQRQLIQRTTASLRIEVVKVILPILLVGIGKVG